MTKATIRVAIDVGSERHWVGVGLSEGQVLEGFSIAHNQEGFEHFFRRVELHRQRLERPVEVAMEGYNGWARPLDQQIQQRGYRLLNVNNLKLARFKEIFPAPAKTDHIDTEKMLELFQLGDTLERAKNVIQEVKPVPEEN
ncbi:MAG: transposase [Candidatus Binatia bacterium]